MNNDVDEHTILRQPINLSVIRSQRVYLHKCQYEVVQLPI